VLRPVGPALGLGCAVVLVLAMLAYELVVIAPFAPVMILVTAFFCLSFASYLTSGRPGAALAGAGLPTALILFAGAMALLGDDADTKMVGRLMQVGAALVYILSDFVVVDRILPEQDHLAVQN